MPYCQAYGCNTHTSRVKKSVFTFPNPKKKPQLFKRWAATVSVEKFLNKNYVWSRDDVICEDHFTPEDIEEDKQAKLLGYSRKSKRLKPDSVPSIFAHRSQPPKPRESSQNRQQQSESRELIRSVLDASTSQLSPTVDEDTDLSSGLDEVCYSTQNTTTETNDSQAESDGQQSRKRKRGPKKKRLKCSLSDVATQTQLDVTDVGIQAVCESRDESCQFPSQYHQYPQMEHDYTCQEVQPTLETHPIHVPPLPPADVTPGNPQPPTTLSTTSCESNRSGSGHIEQCQHVSNSSSESEGSGGSKGSTSSSSGSSSCDIIKSEGDVHSSRGLLDKGKEGDTDCGSSHKESSSSHKDSESDDEFSQGQPLSPHSSSSEESNDLKDKVHIKHDESNTGNSLTKEGDIEYVSNKGSSSSHKDNESDEFDPEKVSSPSSSSSTNMSKDSKDKAHINEDKYIVFDSCLDQLFYSLTCTHCNGCMAEVTKNHFGTMLSVIVTCSSGHTVMDWQSQPCIGKAPVGNLLCSAAIILSGNTYTSISQYSKLLGVRFISDTLYYDIQGKHLIPVINKHYLDQIESILQSLRGKELSLIGDGRCDSPGYSAKYCSYTMMSMESHQIVCSQLVQVSQASSSVAMEKEGFKLCVNEISKTNTIGLIATDRHTGIRKVMREEYDTINHQFDVWHISKSIAKKLTALSKQKNCAELGPWIPAIKNHFWWCAQNCNENWELLSEMWTSLVHHVCNVHSWNSCDYYHKCNHSDLTHEEERKRKWLTPGSDAHEALKRVVLDKVLLKDLKYVTKACHTGELEVFHSVLLKYAPKRLHFRYPAMQARVQLAVMDHNHNCKPKQATSKDMPTGMYRRAYSKATKQWLLKPIMEDKNFEYLSDMILDIVQSKEGLIAVPQPRIPNIPPNVAPVICPPREDLMRNRRSRFHKKPEESQDEI